jgi:tetratricopeptide (TPR) repeat protein
MYRRLGKLEKATTYLEAAKNTTPQADKAARGKSIQLLARVYLRKGELDKFDYAMKETEELSHSFNPTTSSTRGHYNPGTVYEEYGRSYADLGMTTKAIEYLEKAEKNLPQTKFWDLLLRTSKAIALVKGNDIEAGVKTAIETTDEVNFIEPNDQLLRVETERAFFNISVPPWITTKCRVKMLYKKAGEQVVPGDLLISVEPI